MDKKTTIFENGLIWFGAAVSIAEIITGSYFAPLGFSKGLLAIVLGHIIGCLLLFFAGIIGAKTEKSSMETIKMSFGNYGSFIFIILNVVQLFGWTAIMIYDGALAANAILNVGNWVWCLVVGLLIAVWILIGIKNLGKLNTIAMIGLFALCVLLGIIIFKNRGVEGLPLGDVISFGAAVELSVAMPLSWLPLICDYTKDVKRPIAATAVSSTVYMITSSFMYAIGMSAAIFTGQASIEKIMLGAGFGAAGLVIIILSTVTTTFLDAYSAGISSKSLNKKISEKGFAIAVTVFGTLVAIFYPIVNITNFLYLIGSVFAPVVAILIADFFVIKKDSSQKKANVVNIIIWVIGFALYRFLMQYDFVLGSTFIDMIAIFLICIIVNKIKNKYLS